MTRRVHDDVLCWARALAPVAQSGRYYAQTPGYAGDAFDAERYGEVAHIAAEMMASASDATVGEVRASFGAQAGHATPKVDVRGVVFDEREHVLLVRERLDGGRWASWKVFLACDIVGGVPAASTFETDEPTFWPVDDPPPLSTGRVTADQLRRLLELHRSPAAGAVFD